MYPCIAVEHSYNCMVLLCSLFFWPSGHYTKIVKKARLNITIGRSSDISISPEVYPNILAVVPTSYQYGCYVFSAGARFYNVTQTPTWLSYGTVVEVDVYYIEDVLEV